MYKLRLGILPMIYSAFIIPQSKLIEVDRTMLVIKVPITIPLLPFSIKFLAAYILALADLSPDNYGGNYFFNKEFSGICLNDFLEMKKRLSKHVI